MLPTNFRSQEKSWLIDLIGLAFVFLLFYSLWLGSYPFFTPDEGRYSEVAREMLASGDFITPRVDGVAFLDKPVLYYWLQAAAISLFGVTEWAVRLFPMLYGILGILCTYVCGRLLFNRRTAVLSAIVLATSVLYFCSAHYANLDLEVGVLISCALLCFITAIQRPAAASSGRRMLFFFSYLFAALACLTKGMIGVVFPAMIIGTWILILWRWKTLKEMWLIPGLLLIVLINLPWYYLVQQANPAFLHYFFVTQQVTRFLSHATFNNVMPIWFYIPVVIFGFFPWTLFLFQALKQTGARVWADAQSQPVTLFLLTWAAIIFIFFSIPHSKAVTYIMPIFPPLALLVGNYLAAHWENAPTKTIVCSVLGFIALALSLAGAFLAILHYNLLDFALGFNQTLHHSIILFSISALLAVLCLKSKTVKPLFNLCVAVSTLFLLTILNGAIYLNPESTKSLVAELKPILKADDEVISYNKFYQDVPLYLGQRITIVSDWNSPKIPYEDNWRRELWYGMPFQKTDWLINEEAFLQRWNSNKRVFVFMNDNHFQKFSQNLASYFVIAKSNDIYLLSNQPTQE